MRILKKFLRILAILLPVFCVFFISSDSYAVSDISVTYNMGYVTSAWSNIFPTCTGSCLHDYSYLVVKLSGRSDLGFPSDSDTFQTSFRIYGRADGSNGRTWYISMYTPEQIYPISFTDSSLNYFQWGNGTNLGFDVTFILTNSPYGSAPSGSITLTENGTYDVTSYAEAVVDVPAEQLPGDYDDEFNGVITAIYICGASAIMIYFFYIIYGIFIKPTGGYK